MCFSSRELREKKQTEDARKKTGKVKGKGYRDRTEQEGKKIRDRKNKSHPRTNYPFRISTALRTGGRSVWTSTAATNIRSFRQSQQVQRTQKPSRILPVWSDGHHITPFTVLSGGRQRSMLSFPSPAPIGQKWGAWAPAIRLGHRQWRYRSGARRRPGDRKKTLGNSRQARGS